MVSAHTLQWKYKPCFELPAKSVLRLHKVQPEIDSERSQDYTCAMEKHRTGHALDWKTSEPQNHSASLSDTFLQTLLDLVTPLKGQSLSPRSCPPMRSVPSERFGY